MAVDLATLGVRIKPEGIKSTKGQLDDLTKSGASAEKGMSSFAKQMGIVGAAVAAAGAAIGVGAKKFFDLSKAIINTGQRFDAPVICLQKQPTEYVCR